MKIVIAFYELLVDQEKFWEQLRASDKKSARNWSWPSETAPAYTFESGILWPSAFSHGLSGTQPFFPLLPSRLLKFTFYENKPSARARKRRSSDFIGPVVEWHYSRAGPIKIISRPIKQAAQRGRPPHNNICTHELSVFPWRSAAAHVHKKVKRYLFLPSLLLTRTKSRHSICAPIQRRNVFLCILRAALCAAEFYITRAHTAHYFGRLNNAPLFALAGWRYSGAISRISGRLSPGCAPACCLHTHTSSAAPQFRDFMNRVDFAGAHTYIDSKAERLI